MGGVLQIPYLKPSLFQLIIFKSFLSFFMFLFTSEKETSPLTINPNARYLCAAGFVVTSW